MLGYPNTLIYTYVHRGNLSPSYELVRAWGPVGIPSFTPTGPPFIPRSDDVVLHRRVIETRSIPVPLRRPSPDPAPATIVRSIEDSSH